MLFLLLNLKVLIRFVKVLTLEVKCLSAHHYVRRPSGATCIVILKILLLMLQQCDHTVEFQMET